VVVLFKENYELPSSYRKYRQEFNVMNVAGTDVKCVENS
jgi:hypothetical protein